MVHTDVFVGNQDNSPEWIFYVNNNPLIAPASHPVIRLALARSTRLLLSHRGERFDIQSTTGPGNLTGSLVRHSIASKRAGKAPDFLLLTNWDAVSISRWPLSYRHDERNWRLWNPVSECVGEGRRALALACVPSPPAATHLGGDHPDQEGSVRLKNE
jgi:hypothetical protein